MNKKYIVLMMLLMVNNLSFSMKTNLVRYMVGSALVGGSYYKLDKELSKYEESTLENLPCNVEKWARKNLVEKGIKNADIVPLKIDNKWVTWNSYIAFEKNEAYELEDYFVQQEIHNEGHKKEVIAQEMLFHEAKHYQNNDMDKCYLVRGLTSGILFLKNASVPGFLLKLAIVRVSNIAYIRHQETEADRFAFMNVPVEDLEICKARRLHWAEVFEDYLLNCPLLDQKSWVGKNIALCLSRRLYFLNQKSLECFDDPKKLLRIQRQKNMMIGLADFLHDYEHPRYRRQVALVQECIDKRKELARA